MAYTLIPQPTDQLSVSQGDILNNFTDADTLFAQNHGGFVANDGRHTKVEMVLQALAPAAPITGPNEMMLYTSPISGANPNPCLRIKNQSLGAGTDGIDFTTAVLAIPGWTRLPSGIIFQWGTFTQPGGTNFSTFNYFLQFPNAALSIQGSPNSNAGLNEDNIFGIAITAGGTNITQFAVLRRDKFGSNLNGNYFAIGW